MRYRALAFTVVLVVAGCKEGPGEQSPPTEQRTSDALSVAPPIPPGFDYPLSAQVLEQAVATRNEKFIRQHGWNLFAGINSPAKEGLSLWRSWHTSTEAYAPPPQATPQDASPHRARSLIQANKDNVPVFLPGPQYPVPKDVCTKYGLSGCPGSPGSLYQLADGLTFQNNGDIMIAGVIYNEDAFTWLRGNNGTGNPPFYKGSVLTGLMPPKGQTKEVFPFPIHSVVLKHMYWPVPGDACGALPVWDNPTPPTPSTYMGYENNTTAWTRAVAVATPGCPVPPGGTTEVSFLYGVLDANGAPLAPIQFKDAKVVPLTDFFHQTFSKEALDALSPQDRAILDASAWWAYGREFQAGDAVVSIATHILTKEMPKWTMQTFWWHDDADSGPYASDRPSIPQVPPTWRNYLMVSEYGIPYLGAPSQLPAHFNPYIELVSHPVETNCRNCHQRAAWPRGGLGMSPSAQYQLSAGDPGLLTLLKPTDPIFQSLLLLDFQWALSDRALAPTAPAAP
ncbi:hypothetical protein [Pyxidicoccus caerfyrddinensis]|uniref:hypothetical protein n=1 Tax=Pyxidicoccus caerfyrddinensis TaxID=2709663 RepID=UPI0013D9936F|nr:hypothetical protein [Pyxidicoccus caerfyrddinensis]